MISKSVPSQKASTLTSVPNNRSSSNTSAPAARTSLHEDVVDGVGGFLLRLGDDHTLACGKALALMTGTASSVSRCAAASASVKVSAAPVDAVFEQNALQCDFEPSS